MISWHFPSKHNPMTSWLSPAPYVYGKDQTLNKSPETDKCTSCGDQPYICHTQLIAWILMMSFETKHHENKVPFSYHRRGVRLRNLQSTHLMGYWDKLCCNQNIPSMQFLPFIPQEGAENDCFGQKEICLFPVTVWKNRVGSEW